MKHLISVILAIMAVLAGVAAIVYGAHVRLAIFLWVDCGLLAALAIVVGIIESIPKPHIVVTGYGRLGTGRIDGLLIENDGEPAYNLLPPDPVQLGTARVVFDDPGITRLRKEDGPRCFPLSIETSLGKSSAVNSLESQMILSGVPEILVRFRYADGKNPMRRRYTTEGKLVKNVNTPGGISGVFVKQKINWLSLQRD
jgi:hypothetical protein